MFRRLSWVLALLALSAATTYVLRDSIATSMFATGSWLAPGITCSHPDVDVHSSLTRIDIAPFECTVERGSIQALRTSSMTHVEVRGLSAPLISIAQARIDKRERDVSHVETNTLGDLAQLLGAIDPLLKGVLDEAEAYDPNAPEVRIEKVNAFRAGKLESVMYGFRHWLDGEWMRTRVTRMEKSGSGPIDQRDMDMRVTPTRAEVSMELSLGEIRGRLVASGRRLDQAKPSFDLALESDDERTARKR